MFSIYFRVYFPLGKVWLKLAQWSGELFLMFSIYFRCYFPLGKGHDPFLKLNKIDRGGGAVGHECRAQIKSCPSPAKVTFSFEWTILKWDEKPQKNPEKNPNPESPFIQGCFVLITFGWNCMAQEFWRRRRRKYENLQQRRRRRVTEKFQSEKVTSHMLRWAKHRFRHFEIEGLLLKNHMLNLLISLNTIL